jgi:secondary thiamine-phosphate synthase enzyme
MAVVTKEIKLNTQGDTDIINITDEVKGHIESSKLRSGTVSLLVPGSTAGLTTIEYEPGLIKDLKRLFEELASKKRDYSHNLAWQDGNGYSHVRAALLGPSLSVPFVDKELLLGTWQQIVLIDFDNRPRSRRVIVQIIGE